MEKDSRIFVSMHTTLVGAALVRKLREAGYSNLILRTTSELDLTCQAAVDQFFDREKPDYVFVTGEKAGGIFAKITRPAEFIYHNILIQANLIHAAWKNNTKKLLLISSSSIYPRGAPQPIREEYLLGGPLETTSESYAIAKIAGVKMCQSYFRQYHFDSVCLVPPSVYGPFDDFDLESSHVLPALIRKFHEARINKSPRVVIWGSGRTRRDFLHVDDLADAAILAMRQFAAGEIVNVGTGGDVEIRELAEIIKDIVGYRGDVFFDASMPDGSPRMLLDVSKLRNLGWRAKIELRDGIENTYRWYCRHIEGLID